MKSKKILIILSVVLVVLLIILGIGKKLGWFGGEAYIKVAVETGEQRDITEIITANGKIQPETEVKISPDVSGEIVELAVKEGDKVEKGQFLLKIKPDNYIMIRNRSEAALNNAKARLKQAEAQLHMSKLDFERNRQLYEQNAISDAEYEQSETTYYTARAEKEAAEFSVQSAQAALEEAAENLQKTSIYAPMSGTISALNVELGERVVGTELMSGTEILRLADLSMMEVEVEVNENDIVRVAYMDTALIEVDAYLDTKFKGVVTEIPVSANVTGITTDQVTNFNVKIRLLPESYKDKVSKTNPYPLRPGMSATTDIQTEVRKETYSIPIQAVTTRLPGQEKEEKEDEKINDEQTEASISSTGEMSVTSKKTMAAAEQEKITVVFAEEEGKAVMKPVKTGIQDNNYIEILEGLAPGDRVIIAPYSAVSKELGDGTNVEVVPEDRLFSED
ncbi:MAG: efflux RND transporter periplasmic adaptor subunit [Bacteroidales bacterium]|nr:efflux RND transporter periplasmic adaptor subunit [Bacteroidales bacterium]MDT8432252.1 efflux RND transporter periplasmic adaptor subunit [Bacteroidales bacterium]